MSARVECAVACDCGYTWLKGPEYYAACPRCEPGQPRPIAERRADPNEHFGPEYVWCAWRGPRANWSKLEDFWLIPKPSEETRAALLSLLPNSDPGGDLLHTIVAELTRLNGHEAPPTPTRRSRMADLADRCQRLDEDLRRKRAECDELRDRVRELESKR